MMMSASRCPNCQTDFSDAEVKANIASKNPGSKSCLMVFGALTLAAVLVLGAASLHTPNPEPNLDNGSAETGDTAGPAELSAGDEYAWKEIAKEVVSAKLRDPESVKFSNMTVYPETTERPAIICGYVNSRNGFGGMTGPQRFIAGGTVMIEEQFTSAQMQVAWTEFCS